MRVIVTGSRTFDDEYVMRLVLMGTESLSSALLSELVVIHGAAPGADSIAANLAKHDLLAEVERYPADWQQRGRAAGPIRNQQMLDEGKPDLVLAFIDKPLEHSKGTADMVNRARKAGVPTYVVQAMKETDDGQ